MKLHREPETVWACKTCLKTSVFESCGEDDERVERSRGRKKSFHFSTAAFSFHQFAAEKKAKEEQWRGNFGLVVKLFAKQNHFSLQQIMSKP